MDIAAAFHCEEALLGDALELRANRPLRDHRRFDVWRGEDERQRRADAMIRLGGEIERGAGQIADIIIMPAPAPRPIAGEIEQGEAFAAQKLGDGPRSNRRFGAQHHGIAYNSTVDWARVMRSEQSSGQGHVGDIAAVRVRARIGTLARARQAEMIRPLRA